MTECRLGEPQVFERHRACVIANAKISVVDDIVNADKIDRTALIVFNVVGSLRGVRCRRLLRGALYRARHRTTEDVYVGYEKRDNQLYQ